MTTHLILQQNPLPYLTFLPAMNITLLLTQRAVVLRLIFLSLFGSCVVWAEEFPSRTVRLVAPFPAGGGTDINVRKLAAQLSQLWSQSVVVDNVAGAAGGVAAAAVARAKADGYTIFFATHPILSINPALYDKLSYNPDHDFTPVIQISETPSVLLINPTVPANSVAQLIALAKAQPGSLLFGSGGVGTSLQLSAELFKLYARVDLTHVPYKGAAPALSALMSNEIQLLFDSSSSAISKIRTTRVRAIAVASLTRLTALPDLPTFDESNLKGFTATLGHGLLLPFNAPLPLVDRLNQDTNTVIKQNEYKNPMIDLGVRIVGGSPQAFHDFLLNERKKWTTLIRQLGIRAD